MSTASYEILDEWFLRMGVTSVAERARVMLVTPVTFRAWASSGQVPSYVPLFCVGYNALKKQGDDVAVSLLRGELLPVEQVHELMAVLGIRSQNELAHTLRMTKQAVSKWFVNKRFPKWLGVTLYGLLISRGKVTDGGNPAPASNFFLKNIEKVATVASQAP